MAEQKFWTEDKQTHPETWQNKLKISDPNRYFSQFAWNVKKDIFKFLLVVFG